MPFAFYVPDFPHTSLYNVKLFFTPTPGSGGVLKVRVTAHSDTLDGPLIGTTTFIDPAAMWPDWHGITFPFTAPPVEPGSRVAFLVEKVSGPDVTIAGNTAWPHCGVVSTTTAPPLGDRLADEFVPVFFSSGGEISINPIRFECLPSFPGGDAIAHGFYLKQYVGTGLSQVEMWVRPVAFGHYQLRLTIRKETYDGEEVGAATAEADLLEDHVTPLVFDFGRRSVPNRRPLTFTLEKLSGPGPVYYMLARQECPGVVQTEGIQPPLDSPRGSGRAVGVRIWGDTSVPELRSGPLEVTQAVQDLHNSVRLVASKPTYVRFHASSTLSEFSNVNARLLISRDPGFRVGVESYRPLNGRITVKPSPDRKEMDDSFLFEIPLRHTVPGPPLHLKAIVDPDNEVRGSVEEEGFFREGTIEFEPVNTVNLVVYRILYPANGVWHIAPRGDVSQMVDWIRNAYPASEVRYYERILTRGGLPDCGWLDADLIAIRICNNLGYIFGQSAFPPGAHYYAIVDDGGGFMRGCGIPYVASGPTGSDRWADPTDRSYWDSDGSFGDWYGAHEIAHSFGRLHPAAANCGGNYSRDDRCYPYTDGLISPAATGVDAFYGFNGGQGPRFRREVYDPIRYHDVMTYCDYQWMSDYTYEGLIDPLRGGLPIPPCLGLAPPAVGAGGGTDNGERLLITGSIDAETNEVHLVAPLRVPDVGDFEPRVPGDYTIELVGGGGQTLATYPFTPDRTEGGPGAGEGDRAVKRIQISEVVPFVDGTEEVRISGPGGLDYRIAAGPGVPAVRITSPNGGEILDGVTVKISWSASDPDGDPLSFCVQYSPDGATWEMVAVDIKGTAVDIDASNLRAGNHARFRVTATDGINSASDDSDAPFSVPNHLPAVEILEPRTDVIIALGDPLTIVGQGFDADDGSLLGEQLEWTSDLSGPLGTGPRVSPDLPVGSHAIALRGRDSGGAMATDTVRVTVVQKPEDLPPPPADGILVRPDHLDFDTARGERSAVLVLWNFNPQRSISWSATTDAPWLRLREQAGTTPANVPVSLEETGLATGVYRTAIVLESPDAPGKTVAVAVEAVVASRESTAFRRGDSNQDGIVDISDPIQTLGFLFLGSPATLSCKDAADSNDDGRVDLSDAIFTLGYKFLGTKEIPPPGPNSCGPDPTPGSDPCVFDSTKC